MKFIYPAVFRKEADGNYRGFFPDLKMCEVIGDSLDDAIEKANEAAYNWISVELEDEDGELPPISEKSDMTLLEGDEVRNISVNIRFFEGWDE